MGYQEDLQDEFANEIDALLRQAHKHAKLQGGFRIFPPQSVALERDSFRLDDVEFSTGRIIATALRDTESLAVFAVTAGFGFTNWASDLIKDEQHLQAYFVDTLGTEAVEAAAKKLESEIATHAEIQELFVSNPYSPGYCDWDVAEQHKLFSLLPEGFCGITLTDSALMQPIKSVSGVIGIGTSIKKRAYGCAICSMEDCYRRNVQV